MDLEIIPIEYFIVQKHSSSRFPIIASTHFKYFMFHYAKKGKLQNLPVADSPNIRTCQVVS